MPDRDAIQARLSKITPGPWAWESTAEKSNEFVVGLAWNEDGVPILGHIDPPDDSAMTDTVIRRTVIGENETGHAHFADADFIAHAPTDMAYLLLEVARLTAALAESERLQHKWMIDYGMLAKTAGVVTTLKASIHLSELTRLTAALAEQEKETAGYKQRSCEAVNRQDDLLRECDEAVADATKQQARAEKAEAENQRLKAELAEQEAQRDRLQGEKQHAEEFYAVRLQYLDDFFRGPGKDLPIAETYWHIVANGRPGLYAHPTYQQQLNEAKHRAETAEAACLRLQGELDSEREEYNERAKTVETLEDRCAALTSELAALHAGPAPSQVKP